MEIIERIDEWRRRYEHWQESRTRGSPRSDVGGDYPFVENRRAPFIPARRALPMMNLALITSAGAYINGTDSFDVNAVGGDTRVRELPREVEAEDLLYCARGWDTAAVTKDRNAQVPIDRLAEFESNGIIGQLNPVWWSFCGHIPDAGKLVDEMLPKLIERVKRYEVQAALLVPASRLCHQSISLVARGLESERIPTMTLGVEKDVVEMVRPPRCGYYPGELGSVAGRPGWPEHQRRVLDEALRLIEPLDQPSIRQLVVELETEVEKERGEK
ncbi:MAG TPA: glycine/sarcosine/betaine reductase selenoprotein B family protein [Pyrinomonadaceae bacterium]|nr:glycine/sarcosine/betaine reductase selenoprotein B family protein [Pyrinomonadaceae bacterium]